MNCFYENVSKKAYLNYLNRIQNKIALNSFDDWISAERDQIIEEKIKEEAYLHYKQNSNNNDMLNWITAEREIKDRVRFLAYYLHESYRRVNSLENWKEAEKIYIENF